MAANIETPELSARQQHIIEVASRLVVAQGVENTSLADIARAANISKGTLYYYYASKSDLIFDIANQHIDRLTRDLLLWIEHTGPDASPETILQVVLETIVKADFRGRLHHYLVQQALSRDEMLLERFREKYIEWRSLIHSELVRALGEGDFETLAITILAVIDGLILQTLLGLNDCPTADIARLLVGEGAPARPAIEP